MTSQGVNELYQYLGAAWPTVIRPGVDEAWKVAKIRELYQTYKEWSDAEVMDAFMKWTEENDKYPTTKNIINELKWARVRKSGKRIDPKALYTMDRIYEDGSEWMVSVGGKAAFTWDEFINLPCNPEHLDPEEWERRYKIRRRQIYENLQQKN